MKPARPIPTPCRQRVPIAIPDLQRDSQDGADWFLASIRSSTASPSSQISGNAMSPLPSTLEPDRTVIQLEELLDEGTSRIAAWPRGMYAAVSCDRAAHVLGDDFDRSLAYGDTPLGFTPRQLHDLFRPRFISCSLADCWQKIPVRSRKRFADLVSSKGDALPHGLSCFTDGSFTAVGPEGRPQRGWSCIFFDKSRRTCDVLAGVVPDWYLEQYEAQSAFCAECWALVVALWVGVSCFRDAPIQIFSDCQSAIAVANGEVALRVAGVAQILGHVAGCCREVANFGPSIAYIPGHRGCIGNELADLAAKSAAEGHLLGDISWTVPQDPGWWSNQGVLWSWAGIVCRWARGDDALPPPLGQPLATFRHADGLTVTDMVRPFLAEKQGGNDRSRKGLLSIRVASYNALSLAGDSKAGENEGLSFKPARPALLASQLAAAQIQVAAIQEARTDEGQLNTGGFLRFCSGSVKGHFGVELWFRDGHKLVTFGQSRDCVAFDVAAFTVLHKDPRRIAVFFKRGSCKIVFVSLHAPHRGTEPSQLAAWWAETETILHRVSRDRTLVIGADCNASIGSVESSSVSTCGAEEQDDAGCFLHSVLRKCNLWAPATWDYVQQGPTWTYAQRRNGALNRPEFVLLPQEWQQGNVSSWTDASITAANMVIDHLATVVDVCITLYVGPGPQRTARIAIDVKALTDPANRTDLAQIIEDAPRPSWQVSAHSHVAQVTAYLQKSLSERFPRVRQAPVHPYLSDMAWDLHQQVSRLRRRLTAVKTAVRRQTFAGILEAWRCVARSRPVPPAVSSAWLREAQVAEALYGFRLGFLAKALRARSKADRAQYLEKLADDIQANKPEAYAAVQAIMAKKRKKPFTPHVLPEIKDAQGNLCETPEATAARWREHFSSLEAGEAVTREELVAGALQPSTSCWPSPSPITDLPSPVDLRNAILLAKRRKACGPDALPGEIGLACVHPLQRVLFPLALKLGLLGEEGLGFKGGALTWLFKGRGDRKDCAAYRGILLLSNLCKSLSPCIGLFALGVFRGHGSPIAIGRPQRRQCHRRIPRYADIHEDPQSPEPSLVCALRGCVCRIL